MISRVAVLVGLAIANSVALATTFDIGTASGLFAPSFRGDANTTWVGWDLFDDNGAGDMIINDLTPDLGTDGGSFVTTNSEDHLSGSLNYYAGSGAVAEDVSFDTNGTAGAGFTTIIVQAKTLFGGFGTPIEFTPISGVLPTIVNTATAPFTDSNAAGQGQLFAKYEIPTGLSGTQSFSISSGPFSLVSIDQFVIDTAWSPNGFAPDNAIATPEPTTAAIVLIGLAGSLAARRRS